MDALRYSLVVDCPAEHAFDTWTARTSSWWPRTHTVSGDACEEVIFEPRVGGRIFERTNAGQEIDWGEVTVWDRPRRLGYLWHIATDRSDGTDIEIVFTELPDATTRIDIEHKGWERLGEKAQPWQDANRWGWEGVLPPYQTACAEGTSEQTTRREA
ncbi:MAG TPA: SRPBCC domain-containing protein [Candidatus Solibacter sp.]|nr:SRPBCC domain-containing protein [Candidatus Solibacter sp.]